MTIIDTVNNTFHQALAAGGRSREIPESEDVYGWLIGDWELDVLRYKGEETPGLRGEVHFAWVLEGRAIEDLWIMPPRSERTDALPKTNNMYGVTFRVYDPAIRGWLIRWINPVTGHLEQQIGRRIGSDIVQIGARADGTPTRWRYTDTTPASFHWIGEALHPDGVTWRVEAEFLGRRAPAPQRK